MKKKTLKQRIEDLAAWAICLGAVFGLIYTLLYFRARAWSKLTGTEISVWDALWLPR